MLFSVGNRIYETNIDGNNLRILLDNRDLQISSFDFNIAKNTIYLTDDKSSKVYFSINYILKCFLTKKYFFKSCTKEDTNQMVNYKLCL